MALDPSMPVLVVDDYQTMVRIIRNLLKQLGFENVDEASDGTEPRSPRCGTSRYGLVISDWNMEPMTGYELLQAGPRGRRGLAKTPFIMVTAESQDRERHRRQEGRREQLHRQAVQRADAALEDRVRLHRLRVPTPHQTRCGSA
jgi:two-component system chemotaxis response regulator CheY